MARRYWQDGNPVGRYISVGDERVQVVGVAKDGKYRSLNESPRTYMYFPLAQRYRSAVKLHVRSNAETGAMLNAVRQAFQASSPRINATTTQVGIRGRREPSGRLESDPGGLPSGRS